MLVTTFVLVLLMLVLYVLYVGIFMRWQENNARGEAYFCLSLNDRQAIKRKIECNVVFITPFFKLFASVVNTQKMPMVSYKGVSGPIDVASEESFRKASEYKPNGDDIFVVTQMKCGTTWMQQIVFEILHKGNGDLSDQGYGHMYAASSWIECGLKGSVSIEKAPLVSEYKKRIIKTHLPTKLCPYNSKAKYIYLTRHPVSCFASVVDFVEKIAGPFAPPRKQLVDWYCSEAFYWLSWAKNVDGWWRWSQQYSNVKFIHFEALKADPEQIIQEIAAFLDVELDSIELEHVLKKSHFTYMREMEEYFEMSAPNVFTVNATSAFMNGGKLSRYKDVDDESRDKINQYMSEQLIESTYPLPLYYPDVAQGSVWTKNSVTSDKLTS